MFSIRVTTHVLLNSTISTERYDVMSFQLATAHLHTTGRFKNVIGYYTGYISLGLICAVLGPTLPALAEHTHTTLGMISYLFTARSLGYLVGTLILGRLYDHFPGHPMIGGAILLTAGFAVAIPLTSSFWLIALFMACLGFTEGAIEIGSNTLLIWLYRHEVAPFMNGLHLFFGIGAFISPIIVAKSLSLTDGITWAYWSIAILILPPAFWLFCLRSPVSSTDSTESSVPEGKPSYLPIISIGLLILFYMGTESSFNGWLYTYTVKLHDGRQQMAAYINSAYWAAMTLGRLIAIPLSSRFTPWRILLTNFAGCLLSIVCIVACPTSLIALWIGTIVGGVSMASVFPTILAFAERRVRLTGTVNGWFFTGSGLGSMIFPWLIGQLIEPVGPQAIMKAILLDFVIVLTIFGIALVSSARQSSRKKPGVPSDAAYRKA